jgi:hypothetical protein
MKITAAFVRRIFNGLKERNGGSFFGLVAESFDWTVMGAHPLNTCIGYKL